MKRFLIGAVFAAFFLGAAPQAEAYEQALVHICLAKVRSGHYPDFDTCRNTPEEVEKAKELMRKMERASDIIWGGISSFSCNRLTRGIGRGAGVPGWILETICTAIAVGWDSEEVAKKLSDSTDLADDNLLENIERSINDTSNGLYRWIENKIRRELMRDLMRELREAAKDRLIDLAHRGIWGWSYGWLGSANLQSRELDYKPNTSSLPYSYSIVYGTQIEVADSEFRIFYECYFDANNTNLACFER